MIISYIFTVIAIFGLMNAFNMLDGIDGLLASLVITTIIASIATMMLFTQRQYIKQSQAWQTQQHMRHAAERGGWCVGYGTHL